MFIFGGCEAFQFKILSKRADHLLPGTFLELLQ